MHDDGLFREEALRRFREGGTRGQVLRLGVRWPSWAVATLLVCVSAVALWAAGTEVETSTRFPAEVVENGLRGIYLRAYPTSEQHASIPHSVGPLVFHPASGGGGISIGALNTWDDRHPRAVTILAGPAPTTLLPGTKGWLEVPTGRIPLLEVLRPGSR